MNRLSRGPGGRSSDRIAGSGRNGACRPSRCRSVRELRQVVVNERASEAADGCSNLSRRTALAGAASAAAAAAGSALQAGPLGAAAAAAAAAASEQQSVLPPVPHLQLAPSCPQLSVSRVIKGCWQLSGGHRGERDTDRTSGAAAVEDFGLFMDAGITSFDAADHYGPAEALIGRYFQQHPEQRSGAQVFTKYCVFSARDMVVLNKASVAAAVETSRKRLGGKIDLLQLYWGDYANKKYVDAALYLTELQAEGVIGAVGCTNFDVPRLEAMRNKGAEIVSNQVQWSLLDRRPTNGMAEFAAAHGLSLLPYGVVGGGFLSDRYLGLPVNAVDVNTYSKGKYSAVLAQAGGWAWLQQLLQVLRRIADKHATSIANVSSRWVLQQQCVPAVILGARNASHVPDHQALFTFELDAEDLSAIGEVLAAGKQARGDCYSWERGGEW